MNYWENLQKELKQMAPENILKMANECNSHRQSSILDHNQDSWKYERNVYLQELKNREIVFYKDVFGYSSFEKQTTEEEVLKSLKF